MTNNKIFQFLLIVMLIYILYKITNKEYFDAKILRGSREQCGKLCTRLTNCYGFSYDNNTNNCYLSKTQLLGRPETNLFSNDYKRGMPLCTKRMQIADQVIASNDDLLNNSLYSCNTINIDGSQTPSYFSYLEKEIKLNTQNNVDEIKKIKPVRYKMDELVYPYSYLDTYDIDKFNYLLTQETQDKFMMKEFGDEFLGQYTYPHVCVSNISKESCFKDCLNNSDCRGTEWNPAYLRKLSDGSYELNENVCCSKRILAKRIPRRDQFKYGKFYVKMPLDKDEIENVNNIVSINK
jgi:hypothetical protein